MTTALARLLEVAESPCAFWCERAGQRHTPSHERFLARVTHRLRRPANPLELWELRSLLGPHAAEAEAVYAAHNGFVLYQDRLSDAAGIEALPIRRWEKAAENLRSWLGDFLGDDDPDHILGGVPFAHVPHSGNYFVMPVDGPSAGKVFYADHDGWYEEAFAAGFDEFVRRVTTNPAAVMSEVLGCHTRYSDGSTDVQWIPTELAVEPFGAGPA